MAGNSGVSQEMEKTVREYQLLQEQLRSLAIQIEQLQLQKTELEGANTEVGKSTGKVYSTIGGVIVETDKQTALKNIKEKDELINLRLQSTNKQYNEFRQKEKDMREKLTASTKK